jgi:DNA polymerase V
MYKKQTKEEKMALARVREYNKKTKLMPGKGRAGGSLKRFPSTVLPTVDVLQGLLPPKNIRKPTLDPSCLMASGPIKLGNLMNLPYFEHSVPAGYPSTVEDPFTRHLDISRYLMMYPSSTYYYKASGYSMVNAGINHGDMLVVDTALKPKHRDIVIAVLNGGFTLKRLFLEGPETRLLSGNPEYPSIVVTKEMDFFVHGVVTTIIRTFNPIPYDNHVKDLSYSHLRGKGQE